MLTWPAKDPNEVLDYQVDWEERLAGDTIATSTFVLDAPAGLTIDSDSSTTTTATVFLSGGNDGEIAQIRNRVLTAGGRTLEETVELVIAATTPQYALGELPMTLEAMKRQLQIEDADLDAEGVRAINESVTRAMRSAVDFLADQTKMAIIRADHDIELSGWPCFPYELDLRPVRNVIGVFYYDEDGAPQVWTDYEVAINAHTGAATIFQAPDNDGRPSLRSGRPWPVRITLDAGFNPVGQALASGEGVALNFPPRLEQAFCLLTAHWFNARDLAADGKQEEILMGATNLIDTVRLFR